MKEFNRVLKSNGLKMVIYMNGKKSSKKKAIEILGEQRAEKRFIDALEGYMEYPFEMQSWLDGMEITFYS